MILLQGSYCVDESLTPGVHTIFRAPHSAAPSAPTPTSDAATKQPGAESTDWPSLFAAVLNALVPFPAALEAARDIIRQARDRLPVTA